MISRKDAPTDIAVLAEALGYISQVPVDEPRSDADLKKLAKMVDKHGTEPLRERLQREWVQFSSDHRYMHRSSQFGYTHFHGQALAADAPSVPETFQRELTAKAHGRHAELKAEEVKRTNTRSRIARLRQAEIAAEKKKGDEALPVLVKIEEAIRELEDLAA